MRWACLIAVAALVFGARETSAEPALAASASLTTAEFIEVQQLSVEALRTRFGLSPSCQPTMTALATDLTTNRVAVAIECRLDPAAKSVQPPRGRPRQ
jgi:hypothetical protein